MFIPGNFVVLGHGDNKRQPAKQGWVRIGMMFDGPSGTYPSQVLPILNYWKLDRAGKQTPLAKQLANLDLAEEGLVLVDVEYGYRRSSSGEGKDMKWYDNHTLFGFDHAEHTGRDVADDDSVLPSTKEVDVASLGDDS